MKWLKVNGDQASNSFITSLGRAYIRVKKIERGQYAAYLERKVGFSKITFYVKSYEEAKKEALLVWKACINNIKQKEENE